MLFCVLTLALRYFVLGILAFSSFYSFSQNNRPELSLATDEYQLMYRATLIEINYAHQLLSQKSYEKADVALFHSQQQLAFLLAQETPQHLIDRLWWHQQKTNALQALLAYLRQNYRQALQKSHFALQQVQYHPLAFEGPKSYWLFQLELLRLMHLAQVQQGQVYAAQNSFSQLLFVLTQLVNKIGIKAPHQQKLLEQHFSFVLAYHQQQLQPQSLQHLQSCWLLLKNNP